MLTTEAVPYSDWSVATADWAPVTTTDWLIVGGFIGAVALFAAVYVFLDWWWSTTSSPADDAVTVVKQRCEAEAEATQQTGPDSQEAPSTTQPALLGTAHTHRGIG